MSYFSFESAIQITAASAAPISGATMKIQRAAIGAVFPLIAATRAGPKLLAGLTDVPVRPMPRMWTRTSVKPMTTPANEP